MTLIKMKRTEYDEIEVALPFYYRHDMDNSCIYGRVEEGRCINIQETYYNKQVRWELEIDGKSIDQYSCYMDGTHNSNKEEFDRAVARMRAHIEEMQLD